MASLHSSFKGSVPQNYDNFLGPFLFEPYAIDLAQRVRPNNPEHVLELACGTGRVTSHLVNVLSEQSTLIASDLNADMLAIAKQRVSNPKVKWEVIDAQSLPFEDNCFDLIVCQFGIMFFPDKRKALKEAYRTLVLKGYLLFNSWDSLGHNPASAIIHEVMQEVLGKEAPDFFVKAPFSFYNPDLIKELLGEAGFQNINIEKVSKNSYAPSVETVVQGLLKGTPVAAVLADKSTAAQEELVARSTEKIAKKYGSENLVIPMQAIVVTARK
jgi:ubiquinone/menaquinone biosynthesis C-methylase UbiE